MGNTNTRVCFSNLSPREFAQIWTDSGCSHHFALGTGHQLGKTEKLARLLDVELQVVAR